MCTQEYKIVKGQSEQQQQQQPWVLCAVFRTLKTIWDHIFDFEGHIL